MIELVLYLLVGGVLMGAVYKDGLDEKTLLMAAALWPAMTGFVLVMWWKGRHQ